VSVRGPLVHWAVVAASVAALPVRGQSLPSKVSAAPLEVEVAFSDPVSALNLPIAWVGRETEEQFGVLGVRVHWRRTGPRQGEPAEVCRVILLPRHPLERERGDCVMGIALRSPGSRSVWLLLSAARRSLGLPASPTGPLSLQQRRDLARTLGRVAAHELVHVLAPGHPHASRGLMRARLDRSALTERGARFDSGTGEALRAALGGAEPAATLMASGHARPGGGWREH